MEISFEIITEKGDTLVVSLSSSYDYISGLLCEKKLSNIEIIDISIIRKTGISSIPPAVFKEMTSKVCDILSSSPNSVLFYFCDSTDPVPDARQSRHIRCQEYRDKLFSLIFERFCSDSKDEWRDCRIEATIKGEPQYAHIIYRGFLQESVDAVGEEIRNIFNIMEVEK